MSEDENRGGYVAGGREGPSQTFSPEVGPVPQDYVGVQVRVGPVGVGEGDTYLDGADLGWGRPSLDGWGTIMF